jgi:hypothetical protein
VKYLQAKNVYLTFEFVLHINHEEETSFEKNPPPKGPVLKEKQPSQPKQSNSPGFYDLEVSCCYG